MMPGIDGLEVLSRMRMNPTTADVPVVMFQRGWPTPNSARRQNSADANDYWVKASIDFRNLGERLEPYLPSSPQDRPN